MNVDFIFKIAAIGIVVAVLNQLLQRSGREEQAMMTTIAGLIVVLMMIVTEISNLFEKNQKYFQSIGGKQGTVNMNIIAFVGAGIIGAVLSSVLKQYKPEFSIYITLITGMLMLGAAVSAVKPVIETVSGYLETAVPDSSYADVLVKSLAVCYITQMASDSCNDAGEKSIASKIELAGKFAIVILALPVFSRLMEVIKQLLQ